MIALTSDDLQAFGLTLKLALISAAILLAVSIPMAWWLARWRSSFKAPIEALLALPLVLPPTVLGFYLLIALGPNSIFSPLWQVFGVDSLAFSFTGLVIGSCVYSLPFVVQPLHHAFASIGKLPLEAAAMLGATPWNAFWTVTIPSIKRNLVTAFVLGFAHTIGEFGVILMIGGNIPGETRVLSIAIYDHVEVLEFQQAHSLSLVLLIFSFVLLTTLYIFNRDARMIRYGT